MFKINIEKAKEIHKDYLRSVRFEELNKLDVEFMKAMESGNSEKIAEIATKKQELRDITTASEIENAQTVEDLKSHWPEVLNCPNIYEVTES
jgi:hypothetical protein